ncbi:hypothetical protein EV647_7030 [Kribbella sp. VKM Ac-2566]|nr:hypothetical protein EV647_7030 [Kribbella sp. VKM Ac-2566]
MAPYNPPAVKQPGTRQHNAPDNSRGDIPGVGGSPLAYQREKAQHRRISTHMRVSSRARAGRAVVRACGGVGRVVVCVVVVRASGGACGGGACGGACMRWVGVLWCVRWGGRAEVVRAVVRACVRWGGAVLVRACDGWGVLWCVRWGGACGGGTCGGACMRWGVLWCMRWGGRAGGGPCGVACVRAMGWGVRRWYVRWCVHAVGGVRRCVRWGGACGGGTCGVRACVRRWYVRCACVRWVGRVVVRGVGWVGCMCGGVGAGWGVVSGGGGGVGVRWRSGLPVRLGGGWWRWLLGG